MFLAVFWLMSPLSYLQAYFLGSVDGNPDHRAVITEGDYIDLRDDLDATACGKRIPPTSTVRSAAARRCQDGQAGRPRFVYAAMAVIPNGEDVEWPAWSDMGMACWLSTNGHERGFEAFVMWSRKSSKYDETNTRERWQRYFASPPTEIGAGTIFQKADQAQLGWRALVGLPIEKSTRSFVWRRCRCFNMTSSARRAANQLEFVVQPWMRSSADCTAA